MCGYILGMLTHTTAWDLFWINDEILKWVLVFEIWIHLAWFLVLYLCLQLSPFQIPLPPQNTEVLNGWPLYKILQNTVLAWMQPHSWIEPQPIQKLIEPKSKFILKKIQPPLEYNTIPCTHWLFCFEIVRYSYQIGYYEWAVFGLENLFKENLKRTPDTRWLHHFRPWACQNLMIFDSIETYLD